MIPCNIHLDISYVNNSFCVQAIIKYVGADSISAIFLLNPFYSGVPGGNIIWLPAPGIIFVEDRFRPTTDISSAGMLYDTMPGVDEGSPFDTVTLPLTTRSSYVSVGPKLGAIKLAPLADN
jgi:hypothetical protein